MGEACQTMQRAATWMVSAHLSECNLWKWCEVSEKVKTLIMKTHTMDGAQWNSSPCTVLYAWVGSGKKRGSGTKHGWNLNHYENIWEYETQSLAKKKCTLPCKQRSAPPSRATHEGNDNEKSHNKWGTWRDSSLCVKFYAWLDLAKKGVLKRNIAESLLENMRHKACKKRNTPCL